MPRTIGIRLWVAFIGVITLVGCQSAYPAQSGTYQTAFENAGYSAACEIAADALSADPASEIVWSLELATAQRMAGELRASANTLEAVEARFLDIDRQPELSLTSEGLASLTDPYALTYEGRNLDRIFASTYQAFAYLELGDKEKARVSLTRTLFRLEDATRRAGRMQAAIEREAAEIGQQDNQLQARLGDSRLAAARAEVNARFTGRESESYTHALWLHGIFHLRTAEGPADLERARKSLQQAANLTKDNHYILADLVLAEKGITRPNPREEHTIVYLLHEQGLAPEWTENRVAIPLIYGDRRAPMVNLALPSLTPRPQQSRPIQATCKDSPSATFSLLTDVDALVHSEFREAYPLARNRAIASATMKAVAGYAANKAAQESARRNGDSASAHLLATATLLVTNAYALESAHADLRRWTSLPQSVHLARLEVPQNSPIRISGGSIRDVLVYTPPPARAVIVTIRSISPNTPAILHASILQP